MRISVTRKLGSTYLLIIVVSLIFSLLSAIQLNRYRNIDNEYSLVILPSIVSLKKAVNQTADLNGKYKSWIFLSDLSEREKINSLYEGDYKKNIASITRTFELSKNTEDIKTLHSINEINDKIFRNTKIINTNLNNIEAFFDENKVNESVINFQDSIEPFLDKNLASYKLLLEQSIKRQSLINQRKENYFSSVSSMFILSIIAIAIISLFSLFYTRRRILNPLITLEEIVRDISIGEINKVPVNHKSDEIAQMQNSLGNMIDGLIEKINFSNEIGEGNYNASLNVLNEKDKLGNSLIEMSRKLRKNDQAINEFQLSLKNAQSIAKMGNWEYNLENENFFWSDELYMIFEFEEKNSFKEIRDAFNAKIHPDEKSYFDNIFNFIDKHFSFEQRIICKDGSIKYLYAKGYMEREDQNSSKNRIIKGVFQDITERKIIEQELELSKLNAEKLAKSRDEFMSGMSHEIRTPLNGIMGFTSLLVDNDNFTLEQKKYINAIKSSGEILLVIINDILDMAKIEAGKMNIEQIPVSLQVVLSAVLDAFNIKILENKIKLKVNIDPEIPDLFLSDPVRISQIFYNLISNAVKFTSLEDEIKIDITIDQDSIDKLTLKFIITDSGIGIPKEKHESIFSPFIQSNDDTSRLYGGTGLGLSIVKKIILLMGGSITVESELGKGAKFTFYIPVNKVKEDISKLTSGKEDTDGANSALAQSDKIKILAAEDNPINQLLLTAILKQINAEFIIVENGQILLDVYKEKNFDVILMDLMMPVKDGFQSTIEIRNLEDKMKSEIPIIAVSADVTEMVTIKCKQIGMSGYLSKPFVKNDLVEIIERLIKQ